MLPAWHLHILVALGFVHLTAAAEPRIFKHVPIVRHLKEPGGGYSPGSPLYHEDARTGDKARTERESGDTRGEKRMGTMQSKMLGIIAMLEAQHMTMAMLGDIAKNITRTSKEPSTRKWLIN